MRIATRRVPCEEACGAAVGLQVLASGCPGCKASNESAARPRASAGGLRPRRRGRRAMGPCPPREQLESLLAEQLGDVERGAESKPQRAEAPPPTRRNLAAERAEATDRRRLAEGRWPRRRSKAPSRLRRFCRHLQRDRAVLRLLDGEPNRCRRCLSPCALGRWQPLGRSGHRPRRSARRGRHK